MSELTKEQIVLNDYLARIEDVVHNTIMTRAAFLEEVLEKRAKIDSSCGYVPIDAQIPIDTLRNLYDRFAIANRVVNVFPRECWQVQPQVMENDEKTVTEFEQAWENVCQGLRGEQSYYQDVLGSAMWEYLARGDELSGIGTFGIILLGLADGKLLEQPVDGSPPDGNPFIVPNPASAGMPNGVSPAPAGFGAQAGVDQPGIMGGAGVVQTYQNIYGNPTSEVTPETSMMEEYASTSRDIYGGATQNPLSSTLGTDAQYRGIQFTPGFYPSGDPYGPINPYAMPNMPLKRGQSNGTQKNGKNKNGQDKNGIISNANKLLFLRVFDEALVQVVQYEADLRNPRFGRPIMYLVTLNDPRYPHTGIGLPLATLRVHWSRIIHLADNIRSSEIFGLPRMKPVFNRLVDLRKLYGGSAEMYWQGALPGLSFETHPQLGGDAKVDVPGLRDMIQSYTQGLQRYLQLTGMTARTLAPTVVDPANQIQTQLQAICIQLGIPMRVFLGSERGELASSQDDAAWNDRLRHRQLTYISPRIISPMIDRLIMLGILPKPSVGRKNNPIKGYSIKWPDLDSQTAAAKAGIAMQKTQAITTYSGGQPESIMTPVRFYTDILGFDRETAETMVQEAQEAVEAQEMQTTHTGGIESPAALQQQQAEIQQQQQEQQQEAEAKEEADKEKKTKDSEHKKKKNTDQQQARNSSEPDPETRMVREVQKAGRFLRDHENPAPMPGYGQIFRGPSNELWYVGGDGDDDGFHKLVEKTLKPLTSGKIIYEAESFPPRDGSWFMVYPKHKRYRKHTSNQFQPIAAGLVVRAADTGRVLLIQRALTDNEEGVHNVGSEDFHRKILENPLDASIHHQYADWLEEQNRNKEAVWRRRIGEALEKDDIPRAARWTSLLAHVKSAAAENNIEVGRGMLDKPVFSSVSHATTSSMRTIHPDMNQGRPPLYHHYTASNWHSSARGHHTGEAREASDPIASQRHTEAAQLHREAQHMHSIAAKSVDTEDNSSDLNHELEEGLRDEARGNRRRFGHA